MKVVTVTFGRPDTAPEREGWVILSYADPRGGRTSIGAQIVRSRTAVLDAEGRSQPVEGPMPSWSRVAQLLWGNMGRPEWPQFIKSNLVANVIRLSVPEELAAIVFSAEFNPSAEQLGPHELSPDFVTIAEERFG